MPSDRTTTEKRDRPVTADEARQIAAGFEMRHMFKYARVTDISPGLIYGVGDGEYWYVFPPSEGGRVGFSRVIVVDKNTGRVVAADRVGQ